MKCLAMTAAGNKELIETIKSAETMVIDGCPVDCGRKIMEEAWLTNYQYIRLTDLGLIKGKTPATDETIDKIYNLIVDGSEIQTIEQKWPSKQSCCAEKDCDMFDFMSKQVGLKVLHPGGITATRELIKLLAPARKMKVLDIGCGKGHTSVYLAKKYGCQVFGIDILEESIEEAKKYALKHRVSHLVNFKVADAHNLPFDNGEFDITFSEAVLILTNDKHKVIKEASRVLKQGGKSGWLELSWKEIPSKEFREKASKEICAKCISNVVTFEMHENDIKEGGFPKVQVEKFDMQYRGLFGMFKDEGIWNGLKVAYKNLSNPKIRKRMIRLDQFFKSHPEYLGYGIYIGIGKFDNEKI
jgi:ubiquinone/menaquinone biosynthesis C-methylase UbiE